MRVGLAAARIARYAPNCPPPAEHHKSSATRLARIAATLAHFPCADCARARGLSVTHTASTMARSSICVRAAASAAGVAVPKTLKPLNITKRTLIDSNGGRAVRNIDGEVYEVLHDSATDSVQASV